MRPLVSRRGEFLWPAKKRKIMVRRRCGDPPPKIELICDEEIAEAIKLVLKHQFATRPDDLIVQSSRLFGIQATHDEAAKRIKGILQKLVGNGELQELPNGMINFA